MQFLILVALVVLNYQIYKLCNFLLTVDQQKLDIDAQASTPGTQNQRG